MKTAEIRIAKKLIGSNHPPYVIAEMSGNHNGSLERALALVDAAAAAGADAIKLQTYTANTMTLDIHEDEFLVSEAHGLWTGRSLYDLYGEAHTPWEWHAPIMERAVQRGIACFSSPFDDTAVDLLESLDVPAYKIASFECTHIPLIRRVAATGKPIIISTGMATYAEIDDAVRAAREAGCRELILLKCTSNYPATPENSHLRTINHLREAYECEVGLSDHTLGIGVPIAAVALGATVIEKHFTLARDDGGVDSAFSADPSELKQLVQEAKRAWQALGKVHVGPSDTELASIAYRRSIYVVVDVKAGDMFTEKNLRCIRPGRGLSPKYLERALGHRASRDIQRGEPLSWAMVA
ncbi:MAG: pseudaminic acid synthase [Comamonadaceae bacterium]|nr:pseudaminic acid synthase [Comamonadaceae bacterium]